MYHYGGNNPVKYTDPTGEAIAVIPFIAPTVIAGVKAIGAWLGSLFVVGTVATAVGVTIDAAIDGSKSENQSDSSTVPSPLIDSGVFSAGAMPPSPDDDEKNQKKVITQNQREKAPRDLPPGTRPLDKANIPKGVHNDIKKGIGNGPKDWTGITPNGDVIVNDGFGNAENLGPYTDYIN